MKEYLEGHQNQFLEILSLKKTFLKQKEIELETWMESLTECLITGANQGHKVWIIGNGASASMSGHFAADLTKNGRVPSLTLHEPALITCYSNDYSYETAFEKMLERYFNKGDFLICISSSGNSPNVVNAAKWTEKHYPGHSLSFTGFKESNKLLELTHYGLWVKAMDYGMVESAHAYFLHMMTDTICYKREIGDRE